MSRLRSWRVWLFGRPTCYPVRARLERVAIKRAIARAGKRPRGDVIFARRVLVRCSGTTAAGQPCRSWISSWGDRCPAHRS